MASRNKTGAIVALGCTAALSGIASVVFFVYMLHWLLTAAAAPPHVWTIFWGYVPAVFLASLVGQALKSLTERN